MQSTSNNLFVCIVRNTNTLTLEHRHQTMLFICVFNWHEPYVDIIRFGLVENLWFFFWFVVVFLFTFVYIHMTGTICVWCLLFQPAVNANRKHIFLGSLSLVRWTTVADTILLTRFVENFKHPNMYIYIRIICLCSPNNNSRIDWKHLNGMLSLYYIYWIFSFPTHIVTTFIDAVL